MVARGSTSCVLLSAGDVLTPVDVSNGAVVARENVADSRKLFGHLPSILTVTGILRWRKKRRVQMQKSACLERDSGDSLGGIVRR